MNCTKSFSIIHDYSVTIENVGRLYNTPIKLKKKNSFIVKTRTYATRLLAAMTLLFLLAISNASGVYNVHYVDSVNDNYLFRGGQPFDNQNTFDYSTLQADIISAGKEAGVKVPTSFYIIDVNLLNLRYTSDVNKLEEEFDYFKTHPDLGRLVFWDTGGTEVSQTDEAISTDVEFKTYLAQNIDGWLGDNLDTRVDSLRQMLNNGKSLIGASAPIVIYVHCVAGCDRTGELIGAYEMRYLDKSWNDVNSESVNFCDGQPISCENYRALQWYCHWLNQKNGFSLDCDKGFDCASG